MSANTPRPVRMCIVTAQASTIDVHYRGQLEYLQQHGFEITVVCGPTDNADAIRSRGVAYFPLDLRRQISPLAEIRAISRLRGFLKQQRFDLVQACTPKGGLVGVLAARRARVPLIVHLLHGLAYQRQSGPRKWLLRRAAMTTCRRAHHIIAVSHSLRELAIEDGLCPAGKICVLGSGTCNGVDLQRFSLDRADQGVEVRRSLGIAPDQVVVGFVGRIVGDKGVVELIEAFETLEREYGNLHLLILGTYEARDAVPERIRKAIDTSPRITCVDWQDDPVPYYGAMDVLALPSYREGFGNVAVEAAAMRVPVVATDTVGCRDGTLDGQTGLLVPVADAKALARALGRLIGDADLRRRLGQAGRERVEREFDQRNLWPLYVQLYARLLRQNLPDSQFELNGEETSAVSGRC